MNTLQTWWFVSDTSFGSNSVMWDHKQCKQSVCKIEYLQVQLFFSHSVMSDPLPLHGLKHSRLFCTSPSPGVCSDSCPPNQWCHPTVSFSVSPFSPCLQSFPASGSFPVSPLFASGGRPKYWSFSFSIRPFNEYSVLISLRIDWFDLLAVQGTLKSLLQHHGLEASILWCSAFFMVQLLYQVQYYSSTAYRKQLMHKTTLTTGKQLRLRFSFVDSITVIVVSKWRIWPMLLLRRFSRVWLCVTPWRDYNFSVKNF